MLTIAMLLATSITPQTPPEFPREFRAVWVATVDNVDWPSERGIPTEQAQKELLAILDRCAELKLNAVVFQVRPSADALYKSKLEPWSEFLTGRQGRAPDPKWDPLSFAIEESHKRGLELHAWFNPYRATHFKQIGANAPSHVSFTKPHIVRKYGRYLWMDPGEKATQGHSLAVMMDVVRRYDVDGVHIDDYFYPYKENDQDFPDGMSYGRYKATGGSLGKDDWRRWSVDTFVERLYKSIKAEKPHVKFGISPFGIYRPGIPKGIKAGVDQYADLYADARKWLVQGWCDYYSPQLYWRNSQTPQSFSTLLKWWVKQNPKGRHIWPGMYTGMVDQGKWPAKEVTGQIGITRRVDGASGNVHYSMTAFMNNPKSLNVLLKKGPYAGPALIPASPWLEKKVPSKPVVAGEHGTVFLSSAAGEGVRWFAVYARYGERWVPHVAPGPTARMIVPPAFNGSPLNGIWAATVGRTGNRSEWTASGR